MSWVGIRVRATRRLPETKDRAKIFDRIMTRELKKLGKAHVAERDVRVRNWGHKPVFFHTVAVSGTIGGVVNTYTMKVYVTGNPDKSRKIYHWLDKGTKVRYASLSKDWQSKTAPGRRTPKPGRGKVLFISRQLPRPGIKARGFEKDITEKLQPREERVVEKAGFTALRLKK